MGPPPISVEDGPSKTRSQILDFNLLAAVLKSSNEGSEKMRLLLDHIAFDF